MRSKYRSSIERANEVIRRNRRAGKLGRQRSAELKAERAFETLNCANAFARNGKNLEHLFDRIF